jgi:hypothetical protein
MNSQLNPFRYNPEVNQINLVTDGSENIDDNTDVCLNASPVEICPDKAKKGHKKTVSFKEQNDVISVHQGKHF